MRLAPGERKAVSGEMNHCDVLNRLSAYDNAGPASDEMIAAAENALSVRFPSEYRAFLQRHGATVGSGFWLAGCAAVTDPDATPFWSDVVAATLQLRRGGGIPEEYVVVSDDGGDLKFFLCTAAAAEVPAGAVVARGPGVDDVVVASSFNVFVESLLKGHIPPVG